MLWDHLPRKTSPCCGQHKINRVLVMAPHEPVHKSQRLTNVGTALATIFTEPWADPTSRSTLECRVRADTFWILPLGYRSVSGLELQGPNPVQLKGSRFQAGSLIKSWSGVWRSIDGTWTEKSSCKQWRLGLSLKALGYDFIYTLGVEVRPLI